MTAPQPNEVVKDSGTYPEPWLPGPLRLLYRFLLGRPMDNKIRTDSTFRHRATKGYGSRWLRLAGWERAAVRLASVYVLSWVVVVVLAAGLSSVLSMLGWTTPAVLVLLSWRSVLEWHGVVLVSVLVPLGAYRHVRDRGVKVNVPVLEVSRRPGTLRVSCHVAGWVPLEVTGRKAWELEHVRPVAAVAAAVLSLPNRPESARKWVIVPRTFRDPSGDPVEVVLPGSFVPDEGTKKRLSAAVSTKLGMPDAVVRWELAGAVPRMQLSAPPAPPESLTFADVRDFLMRTDEYRPFLGLSGKLLAAYAEMIDDSPHIALSAGPGAGKSTLAKLVMMQALRWGWGVVVLDWKQTEAYKWAEGLPGVRIITSIEGIHDFGVTIGEEVEERKSAGVAGRAKVLVVRDEWNVTAELLMAYWQSLRSSAEPEERRTMPVKSPALLGFAKLDFAGREFWLHDFVIAQRMSARAFNGNADIRECFAIRCLARYTEQTKKMLVGNMKPFPKKSNIPGRWTIVAGENVSVVQVPLITGEEAREFAQGGKPNPLSPLSTSHYPDLTQRDDVDHGLGDPLGHDPTRALAGSTIDDAIEAEIVDERKLSEMVEGLAHLGITLEVLRNATKRPEEGFPPPVGGTPNRGWTYDFGAVQEWARRRHARRQAEGEKA